MRQGPHEFMGVCMQRVVGGAGHKGRHGHWLKVGRSSRHAGRDASKRDWMLPKGLGMPSRYCACKGELWCCFVQGPLPCAVADIIFGMTREVPIVAKRL